MTRKSLPIGIQDFPTIRREDFYYVDKTPLIRQLVEEGRHYFLARPRRFGKSLLVDTIKALFEGQEALFRGLAIHDHWDWSVTHPVLRLSFDGKSDGPDEIERDIIDQLEVIERTAGLDLVPSAGGATGRLQTLLYHLHHATGQRVVVLVDAYDTPILDALHDPARARANRDHLWGLYGLIKGAAEHTRFVLVTGISMLSRGSLFSGFNNLNDISLDPRYATLCGYTEAELDTVFAPELAGLDREAIRSWYNGYNWRGEERLYNPVDVLLLLRTRDFRPHWFEIGTPSVLFETLKARSIGLAELAGCRVDESLITRFDIDAISAEALLFQTGYLTIADKQGDGFDTLYTLDCPNQAVTLSLNDQLLAALSPQDQVPPDEGKALRDQLEANDFTGFAATLKAWLARIPYQWHATGDLARNEAWSASLLYMALRSIGVDVRSEATTSRARANLVVALGAQVFVLEFKMADNPGDTETALEAAFTQMRARGYADTHHGKTVHLVAIACGREVHNLLEVRAEPAAID